MINLPVFIIWSRLIIRCLYSSKYSRVELVSPLSGLLDKLYNQMQLCLDMLIDAQENDLLLIFLSVIHGFINNAVFF